MAISWDIKLTEVNVVSKRARVTATRTDDESTITEPPIVLLAILETLQQRLDALDQIWAKHLAWVAQQAEIETFIDSLEQSGKANLETREV